MARQQERRVAAGPVARDELLVAEERVDDEGKRVEETGGAEMLHGPRRLRVERVADDGRADQRREPAVDQRHRVLLQGGAVAGGAVSTPRTAAPAAARRTKPKATISTSTRKTRLSPAL